MKFGSWDIDAVDFARKIVTGLITALGVAMSFNAAAASDFSQPWLRSDRAIVIDAYEYNELDWPELASDKRIVGFINKASDGLPPPYFCTGDETQYRLCKALWKRHAVARELFQTRRTLARALGLKWGAYHLARPGNPVEQASNFLDFAEPGPDDLMALDIEENDASKWMSLDDAETFVREINRRTGRFPMLYTNGNTAKHIADNAFRYRLLSRLPLWYARYKPEIGMHFPKGNWDNYALWQFASQTNCNKRSCPYRVKGANSDIDVNVASMSAEELRQAWPFGGLVNQKIEMVASVPVPFPRQQALTGEVEIVWAAVAPPPPSLTDRVLTLASNGYARLTSAYASASAAHSGQAAIERLIGARKIAGAAPDRLDPVTTASVSSVASFERDDFPIFLLASLDRSRQYFQDFFGRPRQHGQLADDGGWAVDEDRMRAHQIDQLLVAPFLVVQSQRLIGRALAAQ